ncbi:Hsp33 family molecular chaperone [Woodsholea maritima]|uniref:Hsp33 family molecular chaperone n=1 Tax=Woodsholea maritima TaxID=240237 RepID=UPI00035C4E7A|nr:Hsp33 family molecular chaperone [Woodsholea maritima]
MMDAQTPVHGDDPLGEADNIVAAFQLDQRPIRGRMAQLGSTMDEILSAHDYPESVAALVGEAALLALLVGDSLKFDGRLIVQASGKSGPVKFVVADFATGEGVRGFAQFDREAVEALEAEHGPRPGAELLLGQGSFAMTIDQGSDMDRYQGIVALEGPSLATCAEHYFAQSEQVPTRIKLAVGQSITGEGASWRAGAAMLQKLPGDHARPATQEDWDHGLALFETTEDQELLDQTISVGKLLYRLFHEDGVRLFEPRTVIKRCTCERERLASILSQFPDDDRAHMVRDGQIVMTCEYCNRDWNFDPAEIEPKA